MKLTSKKTVYILLLISGTILVYSLMIVDYNSIFNGQNLTQLLLPMTSLLNCWTLLERYIEFVKKERDMEE